MKKKLVGTGVALVTPFDKKHNIDFQGLQKLLYHLADSPVHYLVVHGTTGEAATTTPEEKKAILAFVDNHNPNHFPIVCGIGGNNTRAVIETIQNTHFDCIDAVLVVSPYYNKPSQEGIYQHYITIAEVCPRPILLYNVPARTGTNITAATTVKLSKHPNIIGIKEASGNLLQCMEIVKNKHNDFLVIAGEDMLALPMIATGAIGVISTIANGLPNTMHHMTNFAIQGSNKEARPLAWSLLPIDHLMKQAGNPVGTKQLLAALGICQNYVRLPLVEASTPIRQKMQTIVSHKTIQEYALKTK
mmetsp:Transcript_943/g.2300  ORF Transcript_943/g.2300 Transcript_943/m.2300 type:complete len:302 (+) Transcript_943:492-1397(+)